MAVISFEGVDGVGKTTQIRRLTSWLEEKNIPHTVVKEDFDLDLFCRGESDLIAKMESFIEYRKSLIQSVTLPALNENRLVIYDRFIDSTLAYQGYGVGMDLDWLSNLNSKSNLGVFPDRTFLLFSLRETWKTHADSYLSYFCYDAVAVGFLEIANKEPNRIKFLRSDEPQKAITQEVIRTLVNDQILPEDCLC